MLDPLPPLKTDPKHGYFPWWPEDGDDWVHPEDVALARRLIPSPRIWRRNGTAASQAGQAYVVMHYGDLRLRMRSVLWRELVGWFYELGDLVEVRPRGMTNEPHTGRVRERRWDAHAGVVRYLLTLADGTPLERAFGAEDLKWVEPTEARPLVRIEPGADERDLE